MSTSNNTETENEIKLPEFVLTDPNLWFNAVEEIFSVEEITDDDEQYDWVIKYLSVDHLNWLLEELPDDLETDNKYLEVRNYILTRITQEQLQCIKLVELFECEDLKPSTFLRHLTCLTNDLIPECLKRTIWLARLPRRIQNIVFIAILTDPNPMENRSLESLAAIADGVVAYEKYHSFPTLKIKISVSNLPDYVENDPELWFYLLDEAFSENGVTDEQFKYEYTVRAMHSEDLFTASLFLTDLPNRTTHKPYLHLRERVIKTFVATQENKTFRLVFRNMKTLKPSQILQFLNDMAAKSNSFIPQSLLRTLWIMQLPIEVQAVLFKLLLRSNESLEGMNMAVLSAVADGVANSNTKETMEELKAYLRGPRLENQEVDMEEFQAEMQRACSLQQKISLGTRYCDYMYKVYYDNSPSESMDDCILYNKDYTIQELFLLGCTCWYHQCYKENSYRCTKLITK